MLENTLTDWAGAQDERLSEEERRELAALDLVARIQAFRRTLPDNLKDRAPAFEDLFEAADWILVQLGWADAPPASLDRGSLAALRPAPCPAQAEEAEAPRVEAC